MRKDFHGIFGSQTRAAIRNERSNRRRTSTTGLPGESQVPRRQFAPLVSQFAGPVNNGLKHTWCVSTYIPASAGLENRWPGRDCCRSSQLTSSSTAVKHVPLHESPGQQLFQCIARFGNTVLGADALAYLSKQPVAGFTTFGKTFLL